MAPDARIRPGRVRNRDGVVSDWSVALGIQYAIDHGVEVINLSLSSTRESAIINEAIARAAALGIRNLRATPRNPGRAFVLAASSAAPLAIAAFYLGEAAGERGGACSPHHPPRGLSQRYRSASLRGASSGTTRFLHHR